LLTKKVFKGERTLAESSSGASNKAFRLQILTGFEWERGNG